MSKQKKVVNPERVRQQFSPEFKLEAVRLVQGGQAKAVTAKILRCAGADTGQLGASCSSRQARRGWRQTGERGANGACATEGRTGAGQDGARYFKKPPSRAAASPMLRHKRCVH